MISASFVLAGRSDMIQQVIYWDGFSYGSNPVVIDGTIETSEWNDSTVSILQGPRPVNVYTKEDALHILIAIDCPDPSIVSIAFDIDNSGGQTPQNGDVLVQLGMNNSEYIGTGYGWTPTEKGEDWTANQGISSRYEFIMDYQRLGLSPGEPMTIGFLMDISGPLGHNTFPSDGNLYIPSSWAKTSSPDDWGTRKPTYIPPFIEYGRVSPLKGFTDTTFIFSINYTDDFTGEEPVRKEVMIDGTVHTMTTGDRNITDGAIYGYSTTLGAGQHQFYFLFSDGTTDLRFPGTGHISGPMVTEPNQPPEIIRGGIPSDLLTIEEDSPPVPDMIDLEDYFTDDRDDGTLTFSIVSQQDNVQVQIEGSTLGVIGVVSNWHGSVELTVKALDNGIEGYPVDEYRLETLSNPFTITVLSVNDPPEQPKVQVDSIYVDEETRFKEGEKVDLVASSFDPDMVLDPTEEIEFSWSSDLDGDLGEGNVLNGERLSAGTHIITVRATDTEGATSSSSLKVIVDEVKGPWYEEIKNSWQSVVITFVTVLLILSFLAFFSYTRLKSKSLLDNVKRKQIYEMIKDEPGVNFSQLSKRLGLKHGVLSHHLNMLEKNNFVRSLQDGIFRRFYLFDQKIEYRVVLTEVQQTILYMINLNPGITQSHLSSTMGRNKMIVNYHIRILKEIGLLSLDRDGRETHCFLTENGMDLVLPSVRS